MNSSIGLSFMSRPNSSRLPAPTIAGATNILDLDSRYGITRDGSGNIDAWADMSGSGNHAVKDADATRPTYVAASTGNGLPAVRYPGAARILKGSYASTWTAGTAFFVVRHEAGFLLMENAPATTTATGVLAYINTLTLTVQRLAGNLGTRLFVSSAPQYEVMTAVWGASLSRARVNGVNGADGVLPVTLATELNYAIGAAIDGANPIQGNFQRVLVYNALLADVDCAIVEAYLKTLYGTP